ncbi:hypothetical protein AL503_002030 [Staphylococcus haemolyticus]|uniref:TraD/TraG TraM recognition site domain-containing protein n=1 Tax=Staphylococcus haemolyticus TaxID=1283 RepID=A0A2K0AX72_STAHA|nr:hypothetical protein AL503_002030 [Staphylococcus haemolyticus]
MSFDVMVYLISKLNYLLVRTRTRIHNDLQTLQQLRDVYGESVDKIVSSNTAIFMYLISNDTDMLEELSKQAGTKHVSRATQKMLVSQW